MTVIIIIGILGLCIGSFLNVIIYRLPEGKSLIYPGSHCPCCKEKIKFYHNVPVLGYFMLKGKCACCASPFSARYPLVEALTALILTALYVKWGFTPEWGAYALLALFLIPISFIDIDYKLILDKLTIPGFIIGSFYILVFQIETWQSALLGSLGGGLSLLILGIVGNLIFKKESMGMGDVKLVVMTGVYAGFPVIFYMLLLGIFCAALFIIICFLSGRMKAGSVIPFGPFIAIGSLGYLLGGDKLISWYIGFFV